MFRLLLVASFITIIASCKSHEVGNSYLESKHHPSEQISKENKKAARHVQKVFVKTQKKNNKAISKKGSVWSKKKKQYTN